MNASIVSDIPTQKANYLNTRRIAPWAHTKKKRVQRTIEYINRSLRFFYLTEYLLGMF